jgi:phytoene desaturase
VSEYNSYKGNAYGMALYYKPHFETKVKEQKVKNLYFTGQLTVPDQEFHLH